MEFLMGSNTWISKRWRGKPKFIKTVQALQKKGTFCLKKGQNVWKCLWKTGYANLISLPSISEWQQCIIHSQILTRKFSRTAEILTVLIFLPRRQSWLQFIWSWRSDNLSFTFWLAFTSCRASFQYEDGITELIWINLRVKKQCMNNGNCLKKPLKTSFRWELSIQATIRSCKWLLLVGSY